MVDLPAGRYEPLNTPESMRELARLRGEISARVNEKVRQIFEERMRAESLAYELHPRPAFRFRRDY